MHRNCMRTLLFSWNSDQTVLIMVYIDTFFSEVNADKSIILGTNVLVIEDPWVM